MNNDFQKLLDVYYQNWTKVVTAADLVEVEKFYTSAEESRDNALNWIFDHVDEESQQEYFQKFGNFESSLLNGTGDVPTFDPKFNVWDSFDDYETYYQRYGCESPEFVVSWDSQNVLWSDGITIDYIKRPDVLMNGED